MNSTLPVILLAAGANSRFFPLNTHIHKAGLSICGKPIIQRTLENLQANGFQHAIIVLSPEEPFQSSLKKVVEQANFAGTVDYVVQPSPVGAGDALLRCKDFIQDRFAVVNSNAIDAGKILAQMESASAAMCYSETPEPWLYGILTLDEQGRATKLTEKPSKGTEESHHKVEGVYILEHSFFTHLEAQPQSEYSFEAALDQAMQAQPFSVVELKEKAASSLKYPWHLFELMTDLFASLPSAQAESAQIAKTAIIDESQGKVFIAKGARIGDFAKIVGPCYIGEDVLIGDYSFVRQSSIEAGAVIGANTEVVRSIVFENVTIHYGYLADSILGRETKVGAGLIIANKRLNRAPIQVKVKGQVVDTRRTNLGLITGEECNIGIRTSAMPGTIIGAHSEIWPTALLYSVHPHQSIIKPNQS